MAEKDSSNSEEEQVVSQEAKNIFKALYEYVEKHNGNAFFHVSFGAFDKADAVVDCRYDTYGSTDVLIISMEDMLENLKL